MNIASWLERAAAAHGSRPALFLGTDCVADYSSFAQSAAAFAGWLAAQGKTPAQSDLAEMDALWNRAKAQDKAEKANHTEAQKKPD